MRQCVLQPRMKSKLKDLEIQYKGWVFRNHQDAHSRYLITTPPKKLISTIFKKSN